MASTRSRSRGVAAGLLWVGAISACDDVGGSEPLPPPPAPPEVPSARRPTRVFYYARIGDRCDVFWKDGDSVSEATSFPCSSDVQPGERIRLSGMTCIRESPTAAEREVPVVCPDPLTNAEKLDLAERLEKLDAGR